MPVRVARHAPGLPKTGRTPSYARPPPRRGRVREQSISDTRAAMTAGSTAVCDQQTAEGAGCRALGKCSVWGARLTCRLVPARKLLDDTAQFAQTCRDSASGIADARGPRSPGSHRVVWGLTARPPVPLRAFLRFPVCPPGSPPSPAVPGFPSSGVLRFGPFGRCPVPVLRRFPSGFPSLSNLHVSAAAGRFRKAQVPGGRDQGHQSCRDHLAWITRSARTADGQRPGTMRCHRGIARYQRPRAQDITAPGTAQGGSRT